MPRKATAITRVSDALERRRRPDEDDSSGEIEPECLVCTMIDEVEEDGASLRQRFARALAYGTKVLAKGDGVSTCEDCNNAIAVELDELGRELRKARRAVRRA